MNISKSGCFWSGVGSAILTGLAVWLVVPGFQPHIVMCGDWFMSGELRAYHRPEITQFSTQDMKSYFFLYGDLPWRIGTCGEVDKVPVDIPKRKSD